MHEFSVGQESAGFTLVEILIAIAIIGILAATLYVSTVGHRERAKITAFKESMRGHVPAASVCRDREGRLLDSTAPGDPICDPDISIYYRDVLNCNGDGTFIQTTVANPDQNSWSMTSVCDRTNGETCTASCDSEGCRFLPSAGNACK